VNDTLSYRVPGESPGIDGTVSPNLAQPCPHAIS
jgi:hypothetical protein